MNARVILGLVLFVAVFGMSSAVSSSSKSGLFSRCGECGNFLESVVSLGKKVNAENDLINPGKPLDGANNVNSEMSNNGVVTKRFPEVAAQLSIAHEEHLCDSVAEKEACRDVSQVYGLENVPAIADAAPDLICEQLKACKKISSASSGAKIDANNAVKSTRMGHEDVMKVLGDVLVSDTEGVSAEASKSGGVSKGVMGMMSSLFKMRMQSQMMMQAMQMRQQLMENEHKMMQKVMRAMARNRAIRSELKHLKKMAYRSQPGNCDCCDGCLPPASGGGAGSGSH